MPEPIEVNSSPSLIQPTPPHYTTRSKTSTESPSIIILDEDKGPGKRFKPTRVLSGGDGGSVMPLETVAVERVPKTPRGIKRLRERSGDAWSTMVNSAENETDTPITTSNEHEGKVAEEEKNAVEKASNKWGFGELYRRRIVVPEKPKPSEPAIVQPPQPSQTIHQKRNKPLGGMKPSNTLSHDKHNPNQSGLPSYRPHFPKPPIDLHGESKHQKQKQQYGTSTYRGSSISHNELEASHSQIGTGPSNASQIRSQPSHRGPQRQRATSEFSRVEDRMNPNPRGRARPRNSNSSISQTNGISKEKNAGCRPAPSSRSFMHWEVTGQQEEPIEDIEDPISEDEPVQPAPQSKTAGNPLLGVIILSPAKRSHDEYMEKSSKSSEATSKRKRTQSPDASEKATSTFSDYFSMDKQTSDAAVTKSKRKPAANDNRGSRSSTARGQIANSNPGSDFLDELAGPTPNSADRQNPKVAKSKSQKPKTSEPIPVDESETEPSSRSSSDVEDLKSKIKPSVFQSKESDDEHTFKVKLVFSQTLLWLDHGEASGYGCMNLKTHTLAIMNARGEPIKDLEQLKMKPTQKVKCSEESSKLILYRPATHSGMQTMFLELASILEARKLVTYLKKCDPGMKIIPEEAAQINKIFANQKPDEHARTRHSLLVAEDIGLMKKNKERRDDRAKGQGKTSGRRLIDDMDSMVHSDLLPRPTVKERENKDYHNRGDRQFSHSPESSHQHLSTGSHGTRASTRTQKRERAPSPPYQPSWTEEHPDWAEKWDKSIVYPHQGKNRSTVDAQDVLRLNEGEFLNDNLIQFYLNFLEQRLLNTNPDAAKRVLFMSSFFYLRLASGVPGKAGINYRAVERWTSKFDIFEYDYIVVPVNEAAHWYLAIICNAPKLIPTQEDAETEADNQASELHALTQHTEIPADTPRVNVVMEVLSLDDASSNTNKTRSPSLQHIDLTVPTTTKPGKKARKKKTIDVSEPRIITLDSLGGSHQGTCTNLKKWLIEEARHKKQLEIPDPGQIGMRGDGLPLQPNFCDCGVFLLMYLEKFLEDPRDFIEGILFGRNNSDHNAVRLPEAPQKRHEIRDLLLHLRDNRLASIQNLTKVAQHYALPPLPPPTISETGAATDADGVSHSEQKRQNDDTRGAEEAQPESKSTGKMRELKARPTSNAVSKVPDANDEQRMIDNGRQDVEDVIEVAPRRSQSVFEMVKGGVKEGLVNLKDRFVGGQQHTARNRKEVTIETHTVSRHVESPTHRSVGQTPSPVKQSIIPQPGRETSRERQTNVTPSPEAQSENDFHRGSSHDAMDVDTAQSDQPKLSQTSSNSSASHTIENGNQEEPPHHDVLEIKDSQGHQDDEMLLTSVEDPNTLAQVIPPNNTPRRHRYQNQSDSELQYIGTSARKQNQDAQLNMREDHQRASEQQPRASSDRSNKRKVEAMAQSRQSQDKGHVHTSPSKMRHQKSSVGIEMQQSQQTVPMLDASDSAIVGKLGGIHTRFK